MFCNTIFEVEKWNQDLIHPNNMFWPKPQWLDMDRSWRMVFDLPNIQFSFQPHLEEYGLNNLDWQLQLRNHEWKKFRGVQLNDVHYLCLKHKINFYHLAKKNSELWNSFYILGLYLKYSTSDTHRHAKQSRKCFPFEVLNSPISNSIFATYIFKYSLNVNILLRDVIWSSYNKNFVT